jgi:hypothetical protein
MRLFLDIEVYKNYFLALFMTEQGKVRRFEIFNDDDSKFDPEEILQIMTADGVELVTFNGNSYDVPVLTYAMVTPETKHIKKVSDRIIERGIKPWHFYRDEGLKAPKIDHIDLIEVSPGRVGLKTYGGRMGSRRLQELPLPPDSTITPEQVSLLRQYCRNDTVVTMDLYNSLREQIDLRRAMSAEYGVDLRSKSDAQIAEAVLKAEFERLTGDTPVRVEPNYTSFYYKPPSYVRFSTEPLQEALKIVCDAEMVLDEDTGHVKMPKAIDSLKIKIGNSNYKLGIGGLHSQESEAAHYSNDDVVLLDRDVESYYPRMMLNMNMQPGGFGSYFNEVYGKILDERLEAKHAGNNVKAGSLKIVLNGTFGKTSNRYSALYAPEFMVRTTLTGQLTLLMLIEALEKRGIPVVSANTDGIVIKCPRVRRDEVNALIGKWEKHTGLKTEENVYRALYSRDVNNYIAVKEDGKAKAKGVYAPVSLSKNPQNPICAEAVIALLTKGTPIRDTIRGCTDIRKFLTLRAVTGGAVKDGEPIGKVVRWYYSNSVEGAIHYATNGNMVPRSETARHLMDLPETIPDDINHDWYEAECEEILMDIGAKPRPLVEKIPRKNSKAWKELVEAGKIKENSKGKWEWTK